MEQIVKYAVIALVGSLLALTIRKYQPEIAFITALATGLLILSGILAMYGTVRSYVDGLGLSDILPAGVGETLFKVVGIALVTKITGELCRDAGEGALAVKLDLLGTAAAVIVSLPLFSALLSMLRSVF